MDENLLLHHVTDRYSNTKLIEPLIHTYPDKVHANNEYLSMPHTAETLA